MSARKPITVVVPVKDEEGNLAPLLDEFVALAQRIPLGEVIYVDDGSRDRTLERLRELRPRYPFLRVIGHSRNAGQSAALWTGVNAASNELVAMIDGDGQNNPADIEQLYERFHRLADGGERIMVMGQRLKRRDSFLRRVSSRVANSIRSALLRDDTRDTGCSLKLFLRADYLRLPYFNNMHRFLPALMKRGGVGTKHIDVVHRPRARGRSKYGMWGRLGAGVADMLGVMWLQRRACPDLTAVEE